MEGVAIATQCQLPSFNCSCQPRMKLPVLSGIEISVPFFAMACVLGMDIPIAIIKIAHH